MTSAGGPGAHAGGGRGRATAVLGALAVIALVLAAGALVPRALVPAGPGDLDPESPDAAVARNARQLAWLLLDHPLQRLVYHRVRVVEVRPEPGHCAEVGDRLHADRVAELRLHSWFGIPVGSMISTCGGNTIAWGTEMPAAP